MAYLVPFAVYYDFHVYKSHFASLHYDAILSGHKLKKIKCQTESEFENARPKGYNHCQLIGKKFNSRESFRKHLIANFVYRDDIYGTLNDLHRSYIFQMMPNTQESHAANLRYRTHNESLDYGMITDLKWILEYCKETFIEPDVYFRPRTVDSRYPMYIDDVMRGQIRIETVILLNRVMRFLKSSDIEVMKKECSSLFARHLTIAQKMLKYGIVLISDKTKPEIRDTILNIYKSFQIG